MSMITITPNVNIFSIENFPWIFNRENISRELFHESSLNSPYHEYLFSPGGFSLSPLIIKLYSDMSTKWATMSLKLVNGTFENNIVYLVGYTSE